MKPPQPLAGLRVVEQRIGIVRQHWILVRDRNVIRWSSQRDGCDKQIRGRHVAAGVMHTIHDASREGRHIEMTSSCERPEPLPEGWTA